MANAKKSSPARKTAGVAKQKAPVANIQCWPTDPMGGLPPIQVSAPQLPGAALATAVIAPPKAPAAQVHAVGTPEFRYWTAGECLRRAAAFWASAGVGAWQGNIGAALPVRLDDGIDLNAYYSRDNFPAQNIKRGLSFFHDTVIDTADGRASTVFSGESADVVSHELGHAVLDAIKPALWSTATIEAAAFHEAFGDMSSILTALQLPAVRQAVLEETVGDPRRNSSLSRLAEQLGYAIRQRRPSSVDPDSLRNASNSFIYTDPAGLPAGGPASSLSAEPHNFSRVFTGAFLDALGGMVLMAGQADADALLRASQDMGLLLVRAVMNAPVRTRFFQSVAEQMILADASLFKGRYAKPLTAALVRRGLLPIQNLAAPNGGQAHTLKFAATAAVRRSASAAGGVDDEGTAIDTDAPPVRVALDGFSFGIPVANLYVDAPAVDHSEVAPAVFGMVGADVLPQRYTAVGAGVVPQRSAVGAFVEQLVMRGRMGVEPDLQDRAALMDAVSRTRVTHRLVELDDGAELQRVTFDCGY